MSTVRCACGAINEREQMRIVGVMEVGDERYELANCMRCGSTLTVEIQRLSPSGHWRVVPPPN
jgi:hypothetical protein